METAQVKEVLSSIGDFVSGVFQKIIVWVSNLGLNLSELQVKILSILILLASFFLVFKFLEIGKKIVKWGILIAIAILIISIVTTL